MCWFLKKSSQISCTNRTLVFAWLTADTGEEGIRWWKNITLCCMASQITVNLNVCSTACGITTKKTLWCQPMKLIKYKWSYHYSVQQFVGKSVSPGMDTIILITVLFCNGFCSNMESPTKISIIQIAYHFINQQVFFNMFKLASWCEILHRTHQSCCWAAWLVCSLQNFTLIYQLILMPWQLKSL